MLQKMKKEKEERILNERTLCGISGGGSGILGDCVQRVKATSLSEQRQ